MTLRQTLPRCWLMTDPRFGDRLLDAVKRLPRGSGIVFRHYELPAKDRKSLFMKVRRIARRRGLVLLLAGGEDLARRWHADGYHMRDQPTNQSRKMIRSSPVHNATEIARALVCGADILMLSPIFATASHPDARPLGQTHFRQLAKLSQGRPVIALGGISKNKGNILKARAAYGWAAIDALRN